MYRLSHRETSLALILPERSGQFFYKSALAWDSVYRSVLERPNKMKEKTSIVKNRTPTFTSKILSFRHVKNVEKIAYLRGFLKAFAAF